MNAGRFDLLTEPWVLVLDRDYRRHEVSLVDVLEGAHRWRGLAGELPTQHVAVLRLLLAIMYRALAADLNDEEAHDEWRGWWQAKELPTSRLLDYLDGDSDRFDLLHPLHPFYQVADLHTKTGNSSGLSKLIAEIPDGEPYFTTRAGRSLASISLGEAARWVVHCQAFDPSGIKSGAIGDDRVKGGKGYPIGTGWVGNLGVGIADGSSIAETLLLNLVHDQGSPPEDKPVWERPPQTAGEEPGHSQPTGPADLLTWQSRRLRLFIRNGRVVDALVTNGDRMTAQNRQQLEHMTAWRRSENQERLVGKGSVVYMPTGHQPERAVWRGLESLLAAAPIVQGSKEGAARLTSGTVDWLSRVHSVDPGYPVRFRAVGIQYGSNNSVIDGVFDDGLVLHAAVLTDPVLRDIAVQAVTDAGAAVRALRDLAANLARAAGGEPDGARERAGESAWSALDGPYRRWVAALSVNQDGEIALRQWHDRALEEVRRLGGEMIDAAGDPAWRGHDVAQRSGDKNKTLIDASLASMYFAAALARALPRAAVHERVGSRGVPEV